jgi:hypothetical protein
MQSENLSPTVIEEIETAEDLSFDDAAELELEARISKERTGGSNAYC